MNYVTESEAADMLGLVPQRGNAWRHLREFAPNIKIELHFGLLCVRRDDLEEYCQKDLESVRVRKISKEQATAIREEYASGKVTQQVLADKYGVTQPTIYYWLQKGNRGAS